MKKLNQNEQVGVEVQEESVPDDDERNNEEAEVDEDQDRNEASETAEES